MSLIIGKSNEGPRARLEGLAMKRVEAIERERTERSRAAERENGKLIEHAREALGEDLIPRIGERLTEAEQAATKPTPRAPWWAESIGLSAEEARELATAGPLSESEPIKVPR